MFSSYLHNLIFEEIQYYKQVYCIDENPLNIEYTQEIKDLIEEYNDVDTFIKNAVSTIDMEDSRFTVNSK